MIDANKVTDLVRQTLQFFEGDSFEIKEKGKFDFVTQIDLQVQAFLEKELKALYPEIEFFAEEQEGGSAGKIVTDHIQQKFGIPTLYVDVDAIDPRYKSNDELRSQIGEYFESVIGAENFCK